MTSPDAPSRVRHAVILLWMTNVVSAAYPAIQLVNPDPEAAEFAEIFGWLVVGVLLAYGALIYLVSRGRSWARYVLLTWSIGGIAIVLAEPPGQPLRWWDGLLEWGLPGVELLALYWLFTGPATPWFASKRGTS